jgi:cytoskeletal protein CcmA (bactofilin family)
MLLKNRKTPGETFSLLGEGAEITGEISFTTGLQVDGIIKGKIRSESALVIGPAGKIDAEASVRKISIKGEFRGVIRATDRVEIHKDGKVYGDIYSPCLIIEAGATFEGRCNMTERKIAKQDEGTALKAVHSDSGRTPQAVAGS